VAEDVDRCAHAAAHGLSRRSAAGRQLLAQVREEHVVVAETTSSLPPN
jgi:hypothetical protein